MIDRMFNFDSDEPQPFPFTGFFNSFVEYFSLLIRLPFKFNRMLRENQAMFDAHVNGLVRDHPDADIDNPKDYIEAYKAECASKEKKGEHTYMNGKLFIP